MHASLGAFLLLQQLTVYSSPPSGDTVGYWQQRVHYTMEARLDERAQLLRASGTMRYVNASPDTLHELYVHQYLNAFRPHSMWSAADERERRVRFQHLEEPHYGFERFREYVWPTGEPRDTLAPGVLVAAGDGSDETLVQVGYPYAPDSTVARIPLPVPLAPGDSLLVSFEWTARPSTVFRRQGRRGRQWDFAHWYPRIAVYDRMGWQHNPLRPMGEFYGEFGTYDVTLIVPEDQVIGATGVPVSGDPGWERVRRWGEVHRASDAYDDVPPASSVEVPAGHKVVRFLARDVHHFAWTVSPDYIYEGGLYDGRVAVHVLYRRGDSQWMNGQAVDRTMRALAWLEWLFGRYLYPQVTATRRLDTGATEFPMLMMNSTASQGLILHELGHIYAHGMLGNNEWRAGWMDEGLTDYQTAWAQGLTWPERAVGKGPPLARPPAGYRARAVRPEPRQATQIERYRRAMLGRAEPIGTVAHEFNEFAVYQNSIYTTAEAMYGALRDAIGDSAFVRFHRIYFDRWKLKHVDELAMRRAAEDACACELDWLFDQWVHRTGLTDYALIDVRTERDGDGWRTSARVAKRGDVPHPMPVGVRTRSGWTYGRAEPLPRTQSVEVRTPDEPLEVRLDPLMVTDDWDRRNDVRRRWFWPDARVARQVVDWPFLDQWSRDRTVMAWRPVAWYTDPGGVAVAARMRSNYLGIVDRWNVGLGWAARSPTHPLQQVQYWATVENPNGVMGLRGGGWLVDGTTKVEVARTWDTSPFLVAPGPRESFTLALAWTKPEPAWMDSSRWTRGDVVDGRLELAYLSPDGRTSLGVRGLAGIARRDEPEDDSRGFARVAVEARRAMRLTSDGRTELALRAFGGASTRDTPLQRSLGVSSADAVTTFGEHLARGAGAPFADPDAGYVPLGDGALRGFSPRTRAQWIGAGNVELSRLLRRGGVDRPNLWATIFADGALAGRVRGGGVQLKTGANLLGDAGVGLAWRGKLYDRDVDVRVDLPVFVSNSALAASRPEHGRRFALRWAFGFGRF